MLTTEKKGDAYAIKQGDNEVFVLSKKLTEKDLCVIENAIEKSILSERKKQALALAEILQKLANQLLSG